MKILLTGRNGQVGWELERLLPALGEVRATGRDELDVADADALRRMLRAWRPQLILNAAAYTAVDKAETEPELAMKVNCEAPGVMAEEAKKLAALLVHYSTDYVFDGRKAGPYVEDDAPGPLNVYGATKLAGERAIQATGCRYLILRTSWVYGLRGKNFYLTIARKAAKGERLRVVDDQWGVPTTSRFLAENTLALINSGASGIVNLVPSGSTTWFGFAQQIVKLTNPSTEVGAISSAEFPAAARRPANSVLDNQRAAALLGCPLPHWQAVLERLKARS